MGLISLIDERMPTEWEQDVACLYVNERKLVRPDTNIKTAVIYILLFVLATSVIIVLVHYFYMTFSIFVYFPYNVQSFCEEHHVLSIVIFCISVELFFCFKYIVIGAIKLYQHYAPEEIRRRCLFMPTCSEYAILAIRKYGAIIGLYKAYYRSVYLCKGIVYRIHYP